MLRTQYQIRSGAYYDSITLMQLQKALVALPGVADAGVMMATPANCELLAAAGFDLATIAARPDDLDALQAEGYLLGVTNEEILFDRARSVLDRAVAIDPTNPTSLLLRAALLNQHGDAAAAKADLDALAATGGRASPLYAIAPVDQIRAQVDAALAATTTTTTP